MSDHLYELRHAILADMLHTKLLVHLVTRNVPWDVLQVLMLGDGDRVASGVLREALRAALHEQRADWWPPEREQS